MHVIAPLKGKVALVQSLLPRHNFPSVWETLTQEEFDSLEKIHIQGQALRGQRVVA